MFNPLFVTRGPLHRLSSSSGGVEWMVYRAVGSGVTFTGRWGVDVGLNGRSCCMHTNVCLVMHGCYLICCDPLPGVKAAMLSGLVGAALSRMLPAMCSEIEALGVSTGVSGYRA